MVTDSCYVQGMNQNSISATPWARGANLFIPITGIDYDQQAVKFVESVCAALNEDRFGSGRTANFVIAKSHPELEPAVNYDLTSAGIVPFYAVLPVGRNGFYLNEVAIEPSNPLGLTNRRQMGHDLPATYNDHLARGTPDPPGTHFRV
ncbi:hypothetical protein BH10ACI3_BH10ACI3_01970 [soil metagenome]